MCNCDANGAIAPINKTQIRTIYDGLGEGVSDEARCSLFSSDEATERVGNAQVLDPELEVSRVSANLEIADGFVKARKDMRTTAIHS